MCSIQSAGRLPFWVKFRFSAVHPHLSAHEVPDARKAWDIQRCVTTPSQPLSSQPGQGPCSLLCCLLALRGSLSLAFFPVPLPEIPGLPPVLLWERAQQKATMVAMRTRKATPAPTATPMMTAMGTDSVGEKQAQLTRGPTVPSPPGPHPVPLGAASAKLGPDHCTRALLGRACGGCAGQA